MALLRKLFYRKPPAGLLEICERVYVFDCCFTTDALQEQDYKGYVGGIVAQLRENYPEASILALNFREGETQSQIGNALSEYDMTIMEYPRQYEGCPLLPMVVIHHFLRSSESWLSFGQNLLLMHCERGGWPVLAFMLSALLLYRKHYSGELKTLDMVYKQAPRELVHLLSPLNPIPSQLRYLLYVSRRNVATQWPPQDRMLTMDCIMIRMIPNIDGEGGCRPIFRIYGQDPCHVSDRAPKVLFSTPKNSRTVRQYKQAECGIVKLDIDCLVQGDVVLECISLHHDLDREEMMFRVMFNTAFIRSNILMLNRDEIDVLWDAKDLFPEDFRAEVLFSDMDTVATMIPVDNSCFEEKDGLPVEAFDKVQEIFSSADWFSPKGNAAVEVRQHLYHMDHSSPKLEVKSPKDSTLENQTNLSPELSSKADVNRDQAEPHFSPTKIGATISTEQGLIPSRDHSPPASSSLQQHLAATTLDISRNQQADSNVQLVMAKADFPLSVVETSYPENPLPAHPCQLTKDADLVPGQSPLSATPFPHASLLEDKMDNQNTIPSLPLLTSDISNASDPPLKNGTIVKPDMSCPSAESCRNHEKIIEDEHPEFKPHLSTASSSDDFIEANEVGNPPPPSPLIPSSSVINVVKSTGVGSLSPTANLSSNSNAIQVTEDGSPSPHISSPKTDSTLKSVPSTPSRPNLNVVHVKESSTFLYGPTPPAPLSPPNSPFMENSECAVGTSLPASTSYLKDSLAADGPASCPPPPPLPPLRYETSSTESGHTLSPPPPPPPPPPSPVSKEHASEFEPPLPSSPPSRDISVARPPPGPPEQSSSRGESTPPFSGNDASSLSPHLRGSSVTQPAPCLPPSPPQFPEETSGGGYHSPPPSLHSGQADSNLPTSSPPVPPPPPPPCCPTTSTCASIPSAPPPPPCCPTTSTCASIPSTPPPPPCCPTISTCASIPSAPPPPPCCPTTCASIPSAANPTTSCSSSIPSAPPPPPANPTTSCSSSIPSVPPPPPANPTTSCSSSIPSAPPPPPANPTTGCSSSIPSAPPPLTSSSTSSSVPSAPPPPPPSHTTRSSSVPSAPPPPVPSTNDSGSNAPGFPSPPPPLNPPPGTKGKSVLSRTIASRNNLTKKLKPLHWLKISRAVSGSLWAEAQKTGEASRAPEIDFSELESLFSAAVPPPNQGGSGRKTGSGASMGCRQEKVQLIDHRRAYNCEIMLSKVKIPLNDMLSSVLALEDSALDVDQVENLIKFCPTKEEMEVLKGYTGEKDNLGKCEQFFLELMQVPRIEFKLRVYSFKIEFHSQVSDLRNNLNTVNSAADQIRSSAKLKRIMQTILNLGNALNQELLECLLQLLALPFVRTWKWSPIPNATSSVTWSEYAGSAVGFKLDSLLKLTETRARNNKMTLMHYLCKMLSDQLPELLDFWKDLSSLELASKIQLKFLAEEMQAVNKGLEKVVQELAMSEGEGPVSDHFCQALREFLGYSEGEVRTLASLYATVGRNVDSLILYFGEDPARCPFEQVISTFLNFVRMFKQAHEENCKQLEFEKKKAEKKAKGKKKMNASDTGHLLQSEIRSVK